MKCNKSCQSLYSTVKAESQGRRIKGPCKIVHTYIRFAKYCCSYQFDEKVAELIGADFTVITTHHTHHLSKIFA